VDVGFARGFASLDSEIVVCRQIFEWRGFILALVTPPVALTGLLKLARLVTLKMSTCAWIERLPRRLKR